MLRCFTCDVLKPDSAFGVRYGGPRGLNPNCKECRRTRSKNYREKNSDTLALRKAKYKGHPGDPTTLLPYDVMFAAQGGRCAICKKPWVKGTRRMARDHCHLTGNYRKLLCDRCNRGLGWFEDNPELLVAAARYLRST